jgi:ribosome assembly protein SQT1
MATTHPEPDDVEENEDDQYIDPSDVYLEVGEDEGDYPMDDDDDDNEADGEIAAAGSSAEVHHEDNSLVHFPSHSNSVFVVATHPTASIAASGGEDDMGYIWDYTTGDELVKLTGHTDSVCSVGFSYNGEMVATADMNGNIRVWKRVGNDGFRKWTFLTEVQGPDEVTVRLHFHRSDSEWTNDTLVDEVAFKRKFTPCRFQ